MTTTKSNTERDLTSLQETHENRELSLAEMEGVSGGLTRAEALVALWDQIHSMENEEIEVEPVQKVPMKL